MRGFLDRIVDNRIAVILLEDENKELNIPVDQLPKNIKENMWVIIEQQDDHYRVIAVDQEKTKAAAEHSTTLMDQLRAKKKGSKFKSK